MASSRYTIKQVEIAIKESKSWRQVCEKIGLKYAGGNVGTVKNIAGSYNLDFSHFLGQGWNIGGDPLNEIPPEEVFILNSDFIHKDALKRKVKKYKLLGDYKCSGCGLIEEWNGKFLVLHLDHINGNVTDNRLENLRFLCPNCHSQTLTYCVNSKDKVRSFCDKCGKPTNYATKGKMCQNCISKIAEFKRMERKKCPKDDSWRFKDRVNKRKFNITKQELKILIDEKSFCEIGRMFGVSDNAIRKRARRLGLIND